MEITVDTHNCSREELEELKEYLEENCWDFKTNEQQPKPIHKFVQGADDECRCGKCSSWKVMCTET